MLAGSACHHRCGRYTGENTTRVHEMCGTWLRFTTAMRLNRRLIFRRRRSSLEGADELRRCAGAPSVRPGARALSLRLVVILCLIAGLGGPMRGVAGELGAPPRAPASSAARWDTVNDVGCWIWDAKTYGRQTCRFWRSFEITNAAPVVRALLRITADNEYTIFLDGRQVGRGTEWKILSEDHLTWS